jgi:nicotinate-nucleotide pyrophosphorylase (carboxylating)
MDLNQFINFSLEEDIGEGDHTSNACIPQNAFGNAQLLIKDEGIIAGIDLAKIIFHAVDKEIIFNTILKDGAKVQYGDIAFTVEGPDRSILKAERLVLNCMQRMSGIASTTRKYVDKLQGLKTKVLDTRKTTPLMRQLEKWAVRIGGGFNHRMGLFDMILIKDNHVDYAGGIQNALNNTRNYLEKNKLNIPVEIETRNLEEVKAVISNGGCNRIMFDNFSIDHLKDAVKICNGLFETEASGGINLQTVRSYAETGVDYVSVGALTHSVTSLDMSLKAYKK